MTIGTHFLEKNNRLGDVVETSSTEFTVHCYELYNAPPLGSLVKTIGDESIYGLVCNVATLPLDPARRPMARGKNEPDQESVYRNNPQLPKLLRTDFETLIVGFQDNNGIHQYLPPSPPKILAFVQACTADELLSFTKQLDFLPLLLTRNATLNDEVIASFFRQVASNYSDPTTFLIRAGRQVAKLIPHDLQRVDTLIARLRA